MVEFGPKDDYRAAFAGRMARHFKGRVHAYQLAHEANLRAFLQDGDFDVLLEEFFIKCAFHSRGICRGASRAGSGDDFKFRLVTVANCRTRQSGAADP